MSALIVCMRFAACSKTTDRGDSNTSSVTSVVVVPAEEPHADAKAS
jgi:hypothetical protein